MRPTSVLWQKNKLPESNMVVLCNKNIYIKKKMNCDSLTSGSYSFSLFSLSLYTDLRRNGPLNSILKNGNY